VPTANAAAWAASSQPPTPVGVTRTPASTSVVRVAETPAASVLEGTPWADQLGGRATFVQFSSAFCAPCRATRRILADVADAVPGVTHLEIDAEGHLDLVRTLGILRTPTTLVLDAHGREVTRATGAPRPAQVLAALDLSKT
jgi:thiol-disulfide isomerase/thioredoxin